MTGRILAVDPGEKRIGIAVSDPTGTIANPYKILEHVSRIVDAAQIAQMAAELGAIRVIIGQALDDEGQAGPAARKSIRLAEAIQSQSSIPVELWDETSTSREVRDTQRLLGIKRKKRRENLDDLAAAVILQSYLDAHRHKEDL